MPDTFCRRATMELAVSWMETGEEIDRAATRDEEDDRGVGDFGFPSRRILDSLKLWEAPSD